MTLLVAPAWACSSCFAGRQTEAWAWIVATGGMLLVPAIVVGAFAWWVSRGRTLDELARSKQVP